MASGAATSVLFFGIEPTTIDFEGSYDIWGDYNAESIEKLCYDDIAKLNTLGYDAHYFAAPAQYLAKKVQDALRGKQFDVVVVGAGVRVTLKNFLLFEQIINVIGTEAPNAIICFNESPESTLDAVRRWAPPSREMFDKLRSSSIPDRFE
ncbi:Uncharacterised protein [Mycobacteroides abscessus]|uniref:hypothetical protein n=1 Tax=Mycobacteroides abscessus TaxID=36809 RepID=UPI0005DC92B2|nr:hypothetical protein [Mycobacteroides abscessus]CPT98192.1 Uncharacterised protein [Mycobacteroides abscessus]CPX14508.1 Uncharacterised protein [Mycobacteroides abscessus]CPZ99461.1 Uncharacterised protein [Mycobacteroides abscessus]